MSLPSAACENCLCWGKMIRLNLCFVVVYALAVKFVCPFYCNLLGKVRVFLKKCEESVKMCNFVVNMCINNEAEMPIKMDN